MLKLQGEHQARLNGIQRWDKRAKVVGQEGESGMWLGWGGGVEVGWDKRGRGGKGGGGCNKASHGINAALE